MIVCVLHGLECACAMSWCRLTEDVNVAHVSVNVKKFGRLCLSMASIVGLPADQAFQNNAYPSMVVCLIAFTLDMFHIISSLLFSLLTNHTCLHMARKKINNRLKSIPGTPGEARAPGLWSSHIFIIHRTRCKRDYDEC